MRLLLKGGKVIDPVSGIGGVADLLIENGLIKAVDVDVSAEGAQVINCAGKVVCPGFIDLHVHLREPGEEHKETIATGCAAGVAGGFTTICCLPNTKPPLDSPADMEFVKRKAQLDRKCQVLPIGAVSVGLQHEQLTEMAAMREAGAVAFSDDAYPVQSSGFLRRVLEYSLVCDVPVVLHCEDKSLTEGGMMHEGYVSVMLGLRGMPTEAETVPLMRAVELSRLCRAKLHIAHVSARQSVQIVRRAKEEGLNVTAEVTPHHLLLDESAVREYDTNAKVNPPLRTREDVEALREALLDGTIDCIATDHAPHAHEEKEVEFDAAPFGICGLETAFGVLMSELVHKGVMSIEQLIERLTVKPARCFGIEGGTLSVGSRADVTVLDPIAHWTVDTSKFHSKGHNTPFQGWELRGKVVMTIVGGEIAYRE